MTLAEAQATCAYLSNELRKAVETATAQFHAMQQMKAEIARLEKLVPKDETKPAGG